MYHEVHQSWVYLQQIKPTIQNDQGDNTEAQHEKTRHLVQLTRIKKRLNIIDLAKSLGTTPESISSYEQGENVLSRDILVKLLKILEIDSAKI